MRERGVQIASGSRACKKIPRGPFFNTECKITQLTCKCGKTHLANKMLWRNPLTRKLKFREGRRKVTL